MDHCTPNLLVSREGRDRKPFCLTEERTLPLTSHPRQTRPDPCLFEIGVGGPEDHTHVVQKEGLKSKRTHH